MSNTEFHIEGPFEMPDVSNERRQNNIKQFWDNHNELRDKEGCYVFAIRNKGIVPYYVGKTANSFEKEIFQSHKVLKYITALNGRNKGTPLIFFIVAPRKGVHIRIAELENFLIQVAAVRNNNLQNIKNNKTPLWSIKHIIRSGGWGSSPEKKFKKMMGITKLILLFTMFSNISFGQKIKYIVCDKHEAKANFGDYIPGDYFYSSYSADDYFFIQYDSLGREIGYGNRWQDVPTGTIGGYDCEKYILNAHGVIIWKLIGNRDSATGPLTVHSFVHFIVDERSRIIRGVQYEGNDTAVKTKIMSVSKFSYINNVITIDCYNGQGDFTGEQIKKKDSKNRDTAIYNYDNERNLQSHSYIKYSINKEYDSIVEKYSNTEPPYEKTVFRKGRLLKRVPYDISAEGTIVPTYPQEFYTFDSKGALVQTITKNYYSSDTTIYKNKFDQYGNWIQREAINKTKNLPLYFYVRSITYFKENNQ